MKIGIISDRLNRPLTGIGNVAYNVTKEFSKIDKENICLINYEENNLFPELDKIIIKNPFEKFPKKPFYFWHLYLNYYLNNKKLDLNIIHSPENASLFIKLKNQRKIITIYDIIPMYFPETFTRITLFRYNLLFPRTLKTSDKIITISHNTKKDLIKYFRVPEDKIKVIYLAANENYKPLKENKINKIRETYNLNYPFILYVGTLEPRKNIPTLLKAFYKLKEQKSRLS